MWMERERRRLINAISRLLFEPRNARAYYEVTRSQLTTEVECYIGSMNIRAYNVKPMATANHIGAQINRKFFFSDK